MAEAVGGEAGPVPGIVQRCEPPRSGGSHPGLALAVEKVADIWQEIDALARLEHAEMEVGFRSYGPDWHSIIANEKVGTFKCLAARKNGELVGYLTWMMDFDIESYGTLVAQQGAWFVKPGSYGVAVRMFDWAIAEWRRLGVKFSYLHNAERGRGKTLGRFFERRGAVHTSNTYTLRL